MAIRVTFNISTPFSPALDNPIKKADNARSTQLVKE
jgi:hypothetical protein